MNPHLPKAPAPATWRDRIRALRNVPPLLRMVWDTSASITSATIVLRLISAVIPVGQLWVAKLIIDQVVRSITGRSTASNRIWVFLSYEIALAILSDLLSRAVNLCDSLLGDKFTNFVSLRLMEHAAGLDLVSFEDPVFYDKLERARRQTTARLGMLAVLAGMGQQFLTLLSLSAAVITFSPWFLVLLVAAVIPAFLGETRFAMLAYSILYRWTPERRELDYLRMLGASSQSAKEVKVFGLGQYLAARSRALFDRFYRENKALAIKRAVTGSLLNLLPTAGYYGAYVLILVRTLAGALTVGSLTFLVGAFGRSRTLIESLFSSLNNIAEQAMYIKDLFDFFETRPSIVSRPDALPAPRLIRSGFEFRRVSFAYPGSDRRVLRDVSFRFDAGERIALIGENGAGKTTLVKLLARLYDPVEGAILLDGVDLRDYDVDSLRSEIGVIFQDYMRYDMLARENIGMGRIEELENDTRIEAAARKSLAEALIAQFPGGYKQMLGRRFEEGVDLSAGQWQKIALARAYMRDAQVLILDEPTASLDARAEYEVFLRFADLTRDKMAVLISHRFSTVRMADRILVLGDGELIEQGTHQQLVALGGRYAELFELQAAGYR
ncbi:MAG TPA: ABC transporter ATP-binding protein [Bryobacteraceae bacterium]|nr:ABC transporter ATP-binding protein [Bryobacteraceae bacterium]